MGVGRLSNELAGWQIFITCFGNCLLGLDRGGVKYDCACVVISATKLFRGARPLPHGCE